RHPRALAPSRGPSKGNGPRHEGIRRLEEQLQRERLNNSQPSDIDEVLADIAAMRDQLARWSLVDTDFGTLSPGLRRIYREGRHRYARCVREHRRNEQDVHDWRKRVKSLYYALDMLGAKKAKGARRATRRADRLGDLLGSEHDLWMLCAYVEEHPEAFDTDTAAKAELLKRIEQRRQRLRKRALSLGARLYKRKPGRFTRRIARALAD
ncbi:MAG: CHAD domain-containing protein, partial [Solirubrobacteraceae bacterium]